MVAGQLVLVVAAVGLMLRLKLAWEVALAGAFDSAAKADCATESMQSRPAEADIYSGA